MTFVARYLTHPEVVIDPNVPVTQWPLNDLGRRRTEQVAVAPNRLQRTTRIISSAETKATQTAGILGTALAVTPEIRPAMHENDRSATGYLTADAFETARLDFFGKPDVSMQGWETARAAQRRIVSEVEHCLTRTPDGDILFIGHGGVGTLLLCALAGHPIDPKYDQTGGGGNWFEFDLDTRVPSGWYPMEALAHQR